MKKQFVINSAKVVKNIKNLAAKHEVTNKLNFAALSECCEKGPDVGFTAVPSL